VETTRQALSIADMHLASPRFSSISDVTVCLCLVYAEAYTILSQEEVRSAMPHIQQGMLLTCFVGDELHTWWKFRTLELGLREHLRLASALVVCTLHQFAHKIGCINDRESGWDGT
jgi:hypothetical protein